METYNLAKFLYVFMYLSVSLKLCFSAHDTLTQSQSLTVGKTLISSDQTFELGFFSPAKSNNKTYLGIWYKATPKAVVWVANRNNPLVDSFGELSISENQSQLVLLNSSKGFVWSSNLSSKLGAKSTVAQLLDSGNLVLGENGNMSNSEFYLWQSFDHPTDTFLEGMKLGWDLNSGIDRFLTSWKSDDDPSTGDYTYRVSKKGLPQIVLSMGLATKFRTGVWDGIRFSGVYDLSKNNDQLSFFKSKLVLGENVSYYMLEANSEIVSRLMLNHSGLIQHLMLDTDESSSSDTRKWEILYERPYEPCDNYGYCGANGICRISGNPICDCLVGFARRWVESWEALNLSNGCKRKAALNCEKGDGFVNLAGVKLPDLLDFRLSKSMSLEECREECLKNCNCSAYANSDIRKGGSGCLMWFGNLIDVREFGVKGSEQDLYLRLSAKDIRSINASNKMKKLKLILIVSIVSGVFFLGLVLCCKKILSRKNVKGQNMDHEDIELPLFDLSAISIATNNFSPSNIIGQGGFGQVYKGNLATGQEVAIKRLSKDSRQGLKEFRNEVDLIAKLQHKNLVALLGCCVQGDERILIYEYMPNKSLDSFLLGRQSRAILPWEKKFFIIMGISRGLLYLHHDSKLQIVHRDFKASNILLDINMIPKISDFGLARLLGGDENETTTRRVVGTYGYMSPEYAFHGKVSLKSDVYSFGVVLLEIVTGERNTKFSHPDHSHNLLGHAWLLWNEGKALQLIENACFDEGSLVVESQILRCINVGLLCVQKYAEDRPTMNSVVLMLANADTKLPSPKEPGFFAERSSSNDVNAASSSAINRGSNASDIGVTITQLHGR